MQFESAAFIVERPSNVAYSPNPSRIHTIKTQAAETLDKSIKGTAILNNELFIISQLDSEVEVYDCTSLALRRRWQLNDLGDPDDATSCVRNRCIYISDNKTDGKEIFRIDVDGNIINRWSIGEESGRLSVTDQATVILSLFNSSKLVEYSPDGLLIRVLNLLGHGLTHPMHAIRLNNGNFVMTQGYLDDPTHKICEVTSDGKMIRSFGAEKGPGVAQLMNPTYLAVDRDGSILVADAGNGRVMLIGSNLEFKRELITKRNGLHIPTRICLDDINGRLYVAEYKKDLRSLLVFNIR